MKSKISFGKLVVMAIGLAMFLSIPGTMWPLQAAASDEANEPKNQPERQNEWRNFQNRHNGSKWKIEWHKKSLTPKKITGGGIKASDFGISRVHEGNMDALAKSFIGANESLLKIKHSDLKIINLDANTDLKTISYRQLYSNIPVYNSVVTVATKNDKIVAFRANHHTGISISTTPSITKEQAVNIAKSFLNISNNDGTIQEPSLVIYPLEDGGTYALTYELSFPVIKNPFIVNDKPIIQPTVFVDAHTGAIRNVIDTIVYADLSGQVSGAIYPVYPSVSPQEDRYFMNEWIDAGGIQATTDQNGLYSISGLTEGNVNVSAYLQGPWAVVHNVQRTNPAYYSATISVPGMLDWNWVSYDGSYYQEESNAYYHVNVIHDYIKNVLGQSSNQMDFQLSVYVNDNVAYTCNAYYNGTLHFFEPTENRCESSGLDAACIYHEYGHGINDHVCPVYWDYFQQTGNLDEGLADYWAATVLDSARGPLFIYGYPDGLRRTDTDKKYPEYYTFEPHSGAEIISGALWGIREALKGSLGVLYIDRLAANALSMGPMTFSDLVEDILVADDDNEDLSDGTPNINIICQSFWDDHGIFNDFCEGHTNTAIVEITSHTPKMHNTVKTGAVTIKGSAHGSMSSPFASYKLEYANENSPDNWSVISTSSIEVVNNVLGQWDVTNLSAGTYNIRVAVTDESGLVTPSYGIRMIIDKDLKDGWPIIGDRWVEVSSTPLIADLDKNGYKDVIMGSYQNLYARNYDGTSLPGWSSSLYGSSFSKAAMGDIDDNGDNEVVFEFVGGTVRAYHSNGTAAWTYNLYYDRTLGSPVLSDLNGNDTDKKMKTIFGSDNGNLYVLDDTGNLVWSASTAGAIQTTAAVADIDGDGFKEIVVNSFDYSSHVYIYIISYDGNIRKRIDVTVNNPYTNILWLRRHDSAPVLYDLDKDGQLEIVSGMPDGSVGVWELDGTLVWRYYDTSLSEISKIMHTPTIGDIDHDGNAEVVITSGYKIYALNYDGSPVFDPIIESQGMYSIASAILYDLDGDNNLEIIHPNYTKVAVYSNNGTEMESFINKFNTGSTWGGDVVIDDLDNNGKPDIVYGSGVGLIYVWEVDTQVAGPDLVFSSISGATSGVAGSSIPVSYTMCNQGTEDIGSYFTSKVYLSTDATIASDDTPIATLGTSASQLPAGTCYSADIYTLIPAGMAPGVYYIGAIADTSNIIVESNESNNATAGNTITVTGLPDLLISSVSGPSTGVIGSTLTTSFSTCNMGTVTTSTTYDTVVYLSTDATITSEDTPIYTLTMSANNPPVGQCWSGPQTEAVPSWLTPGVYYIGAIADPTNQVTESIESNNALTGNTITLSSPDTTPPTGTVIINSGATYTNTTIVTLTLSASDDSGVSQMKFSDDGITWTDPEAYATSRTWTLDTGDGMKTVYVAYQDTVGNWSTATISDTITLDTVGPVSSVTAPDYSTDTSKSATFTVQWSATDAGSGVSTYDVDYRLWSSTTYTSWVANSAITSKAFTGSAGQTYYFRVRARDAAGNVGSYTADKSVVVPYDQSSGTFNGTWYTVSDSNLYQGSARYTTVTNRYMTYNFTNAKEVSVIVTKRSSAGYAKFYIGSTLIKTVSLYSASTAYRQKVIVQTYATATSGTVKVVVSGTKESGSSGYRVEIDGIGIKK